MGKECHQLQLHKGPFGIHGHPNLTQPTSLFLPTTNDPANGRQAEDGVHIQTIWGELAYQLGGKSAYELVRKTMSN